MSKVIRMERLSGNDIQSNQSDIQSSQSAMIFRLIGMQTVTAISLNNSV